MCRCMALRSTRRADGLPIWLVHVGRGEIHARNKGVVHDALKSHGRGFQERALRRHFDGILFGDHPDPQDPREVNPSELYVLDP